MIVSLRVVREDRARENLITLLYIFAGNEKTRCTYSAWNAQFLVNKKEQPFNHKIHYVNLFIPDILQVKQPCTHKSNPKYCVTNLPFQLCFKMERF